MFLIYLSIQVTFSLLAWQSPSVEYENTFYWIAEERGINTKDTPLLDSNCDTLATVTQRFRRKIRLEGTGRTKSGDLINVSACKCSPPPGRKCYQILDVKTHPWGMGVKSTPLVPFRSVAVDPKEIPIGTILYVEELDGMPIPGKSPWGDYVHDGCLWANDRGGAVSGKQLDIFIGKKTYFSAFLHLKKSKASLNALRCPDGKAMVYRESILNFDT